MIGTNVQMAKSPKPVRSLQGFDMLLIESIDEALSSLVEPAKSAIYHHLESSFDMKKSEIIFRPNDFYDAMERIFGSGAVHLQSLFMKKLNEKMGRSCMVVQLSDFFAAAAAHNKNAKCYP